MGPSQPTVLDEATELVDGPRNADYGHPLEDFTRIATMWSALLGVDIEPEQVAYCMCCVKLSRQTNKPKRDNLVDLAGYARTAEMVLDAKTASAEEVKPIGDDNE